MFIDFLHRFVIDHINCYYFLCMTYSIGENHSCEAKGKIRQSQPLVGQDGIRRQTYIKQLKTLT